MEKGTLLAAGSIFLLLVSALDISAQSAQPFNQPPLSQIPQAADHPSQNGLDTNDLVVIGTRINPDRAAKNFGTVLRECTGNQICNGVLDSALAEFGVPNGTVKTVVDFIPNVTQGGEGTSYQMKLPAGYSFCHLKMDFYSAVPATGNRASFIDINMTAAVVTVNTWTPVRNLGQGRSWVDAFITVQGVRNEVADRWYSSGKCRVARNERLYCRGDFSKSQTNHGEPGCRDTVY